MGEVTSKIGIVGLGKLGLPCALAMERHGGYEIYGFDTSPQVINQIKEKSVDYWEANVNEYLKTSKINLKSSAASLVEICDVIFVAVPTPHAKDFEGLTPVPNDRRDFDYSYLKAAIFDISQGLKKFPNRNPIIVVISTVLPGTMRKEVFPVLAEVRENFRFVYNPYFIAMGTTIYDFLNPEFLLLGSNSKMDLEEIAGFYSFLNAKIMPMAIESAELTKVAYNTFIGFKIVFANALSEIVEARGGDVDEITTALGQASHRLMSPMYLSAGMGDGGGCHPRDQIAMSWLAKDSGMSVDVFEFIAQARDKQTKRQGELIKFWAEKTRLKPLILGKAYKANSPLTIGSPALLLCHYLTELSVDFDLYDPWIDGGNLLPVEPRLFFIATKHKVFEEYLFPAGSTIIDPWGYLKDQPGCSFVRPGRNQITTAKNVN